MLKNKFKLFVFIITIVLFVSSICLAATVSSKNATLEIVENNICTIKITDSTIFEKKIIDYNLEKKEIALQLKVTNNSDPIFNKPTEIFLVIDNSGSMKDLVSTNVTRLKAVTDSAKELANKLMENENVKIGVVSFSTGDNEGTITDATLKVTPTNNLEDVLSAITSIAEGNLGDRTNIDAGLTVASQNFSEDIENKYLILLTDGVPNTSVGGPILKYSGETATNTKNKLKSLENDGITIFSVMTGVPDVIEPSSQLTYKQLAEEIFGTTSNPTVGKFYYINDNQIDETICETVFSNFVDTSINTLTNLKIYDYFPQEIVDNFDFSYVSSPTLGTVSADIDLQNNMIVWTIEKLEPGDSANLSYKLSVKENIDEKIIGTVLDTNEKVDITADELENGVSSNVTPKVRLVDHTTTNNTIPQTGSTPTSMLVFSIVVIAGISFGISYYNLNRKLK